MRNLRYSGGFVAADGTVWRVDILQEGYVGDVSDLTFPYDEPLVIAWQETGKEEPVQGATATLKIESPGDRTFIDLYTVEAGFIVMQVYRDGALYWAGCLDPEFYEEPYDRGSRYDVTLTFTDFGILDRLKWENRDFCTLDSIVAQAVELAGIVSDTGATVPLLADEDVPIYVHKYANDYRDPLLAEGNAVMCGLYTLVSSTLHAGQPLSLDKITVAGANFLDEDDEPRTWRQVLEAVLQPLALRIVQRGGMVWVYDINALASAQPSGVIEWDGEGSMLSADRVINSCSVTFSPYDNPTLFDGSLDAADCVDRYKTPTATYMVQHPDARGNIEGFELWEVDVERTKVPYETLNSRAYGNAPFDKLFRVRSIYSGNDEAVVLAARRGANVSDYSTAYGAVVEAYPGGINGGQLQAKPIIRTKPAYVGPAAVWSVDYMLKISIQALVDVRYNPYEPAAKTNEEGNWSRLQNWANFGYIPATLLLKDANGNILYHYDNLGTVSSGSCPPGGAKQWVAGAPSRLDTYMLCWYSTSDRKSASGWGGWQPNRAILGYYRDALPAVYSKRGDGDYIPLPPRPGYIELTVYDAILARDYGPTDRNMASILRWVGLKEPRIEVTDKWGKDIDAKDVEYKGWVNRFATEGLAIETECGTSADVSPIARGALLDTTSMRPIEKMTRGGVTDCLERLLIGTVYSQYSTRHTRLSGDCVPVPWGLPLMTERNQPDDARFMLAGETLDCRAAVTDAVWVEALPDDWEGLEFDD